LENILRTQDDSKGIRFFDVKTDSGTGVPVLSASAAAAVLCSFSTARS